MGHESNRSASRVAGFFRALLGRPGRRKTPAEGAPDDSTVGALHGSVGGAPAGASRVALIVVHGVADQVAGETARSVVDLLVANTICDDSPDGTHPPRRVRYASVGTDSLTLAVPPLQPSSHAPAPRADATPTTWDRPIGKSFKQSLKSDFYRQDWQADGKARAQPATRGFDLGLQRTDYLLTKARDNHPVTEAYDTGVATVRRTDAEGSTKSVDVYEMYWADLSRLSGFIPRIVTELFTLVFRFSKLGRGTVQAARSSFGDHAPFSWKLLDVLQTWLDWLFVNGLALLFAQLGMLALVIVPFSMAIGHENAVRLGFGVALVFVGALWFVYHRSRTGRLPSQRSIAVAATAAGLALLFVESTGAWLPPVLWLALLTLAFNSLLHVADDRFPFTHKSGMFLWLAVSLASIGVFVLFLRSRTNPLSLEHWVQGALFGFEVILQAIKSWWIGGAVLVVVWWCAGWAASRRRGHEASASVATGRIGLFVSLAAFVVMCMAVWALGSAPLEASVSSANIRYDHPQIFRTAEFERGTSDARALADKFRSKPAGPAKGLACTCNAPQPRLAEGARLVVQPSALVCVCPAPGLEPDANSAASFLKFRYEDSTASFSVVAALLLVLLLYLVAMVVPSVLAELELIKVRFRTIGRRKAGAAVNAANELRAAVATRNLGRWLTGGFRHGDRAVEILVALASLGAVGVGIDLLMGTAEGSRAVGHPGGFFGFVSEIMSRFREDVVPPVAYFSQELLKPLVLSVAGVAAALTAFGGVLSRYLPGLRAPLDVALDVDNYLREFPRKAIPRARIFSRYFALLVHVAELKYDRIVIVAHSQGTVISAELLRFLDSRIRDNSNGARGLSDWLPEVRLVTFGCPLRQLYAARFPSMYGWVLKNNGSFTGPTAADIGAARWTNGYSSGDYVGRWLWSSPADPDPVGSPMTDTVHGMELGRADAYSRFVPMPPLAADLKKLTEIEMCVGFGAHTHYFDIDQQSVAWLIDFNIAD